MISPNLASAKLEGTEARIRKILKDLNGRATAIVRGSSERKGTAILYVAVPANELGWLDKVAKDIGCTKHEIPSLPEHEKALCGVLTVNRRHHEGRCRACAKVRAQTAPAGKRVPTKTPKASASKTIGKIEPGQNFDLDGVIASIEVTYDRLFSQLEFLENLLNNLKGYRDAKGKLDGLEQEAKDRMNAARNLLNNSKI